MFNAIQGAIAQDAPKGAMDFLARLIGGGGASSSSKNSASQSPQQRLARFKRIYGQLLHTWRGSSGADPIILDSIRILISKITHIVQEEVTTPIPHPCLAFAASSQIYVNISKIASRSRNDPIIRETVLALGALIDSEEEEFLENDTFSQSLMDFVSKIAGANSLIIAAETESDLVELLFGIAAKIRLQPEILQVWFFRRNLVSRTGQDSPAYNQKFEGTTRKEDFPLFYTLIEYVHHEGRVGDFARLGLLYIIESASNSEDLEIWLVESDLATLMASGLGALYSQLSRKLFIEHPKDDLPAILALSDYVGPKSASGIESSISPDFKSHLDTFLSYLVFWQDALEYCKSYDVKQTLLDHFQVLFLQQLLYPSLLESSDDDGSAVAVLTYLYKILDTLSHPDLIHLILSYLLALPEHTPAKGGATPRSLHSSRRRKSLEMLSSFTEDQDNASPDLFNLVDLVLTSLRSRNEQTVVATLKLLSVILQRHHRYAIATLLQIMPVAPDSSRTLGAHNMELQMFISMAEEVATSDDIDESYANHLHDNQILLEDHPCSAAILDPKKLSTISRKQSMGSIFGGGAPRELYPHTLRPEDPLLHALVPVLASFWTNSVETNLSLTAAIIDLASCGYTRLEGWLLLDASTYDYSSPPSTPTSLDLSSFLLALPPSPTTISDQTRAQAILTSLRTPISHPLPPLLSTLRALLSALPSYTSQLPNFPTLLATHKSSFRISSELSDALFASTISTPHQTHAQNPKPTPASALDSISARIFSTPPAHSRSSSPVPARGRAPATQTPAASRPGLRPSLVRPPSPSPSNRAFSPSPLRTTSTRAGEFAPDDEDGEERRTRAVPRTIRAAPSGTIEGARSGRLLFYGLRGEASSEAGSVRSGSEGTPVPPVAEDVEVGVGLFLTNVLLLREFLLEVAALVQVRASLFGDVGPI
ncbi:MAG: hypothetical protein M1814_004449 [Vezdaea aestivalis]|nr:MAG: hypothetical protein M1814_004449 [Vezdaea aestivalis]